jgi:hypothetical protein
VIFCENPIDGCKCPPFNIHLLADGTVAQLVEQRTENPCVPGSIPGCATTFRFTQVAERATCGTLVNLSRRSTPRIVGGELNWEISRSIVPHTNESRAKALDAQVQAAILLL